MPTKVFARPKGRGPVLLRSAVRPIKRKRVCPYCLAILRRSNPGLNCSPCEQKLKRGIRLRRKRR